MDRQKKKFWFLLIAAVIVDTLKAEAIHFVASAMITVSSTVSPFKMPHFTFHRTPWPDIIHDRAELRTPHFKLKESKSDEPRDHNP